MLALQSKCLLVSILIVVTMFKLANGCNCTRSLAVDRLCRSDFVFKAHVKSEFIRIDSAFGYYRLRIKEVFKGSEACDEAFRTQRLYSSCDCHPLFSAHEDYLITGRIKNAYLGWCDSCDFFKHWHHLSHEERVFIEDRKYCDYGGYPKSLDKALTDLSFKSANAHNNTSTDTTLSFNTNSFK